MSQHLSVLVAVSALPIAAFAQGNLVFNGGFDSNAAGWLATNIGVDGGYHPSKGNPGGHFFLDNAPSPSVDPTISQTINGLVTGITYIVSGDTAFSRTHGGSFPTEPSFRVAIDGVSSFEYATQGELGWQHFEFFYTAPASSAVLSLSSQINNTDISYLVDNIWIQAIPEPSAFALCLAGGIIAASLRIWWRVPS